MIGVLSRAFSELSREKGLCASKYRIAWDKSLEGSTSNAFVISLDFTLSEVVCLGEGNGT